ncbi:hypothetical protein Lal_00031710 [Lupinus albus]|nr:hypothetical protein Lal_00031710 [Lupinus albus]
MQQGIVSGKVALLPRSTEIQPLSLRFIPPISNTFRSSSYNPGGLHHAPLMGDEASLCKVGVPQAQGRDEVTYNVVCDIASGHNSWCVSMVPCVWVKEFDGWVLCAWCGFLMRELECYVKVRKWHTFLWN